MPGLGAAGGVAGLSQQQGAAGEAGGDGTILYIDPNDPQAAEILQQAGLRLTDDGTVTSLAQEAPSASAATTTAPSMESLDVAQVAQAVGATPAPVPAPGPAPTPALGNLGVTEGDLSMPLIDDTSKVAAPLPVRVCAK